MIFVEVGDEAWLDWPPAEQLAGQRAGGWAVGREKAGKPGEVLACLLG